MEEGEVVGKLIFEGGIEKCMILKMDCYRTFAYIIFLILGVDWFCSKSFLSPGLGMFM